MGGPQRKSLRKGGGADVKKKEGELALKPSWGEERGQTSMTAGLSEKGAVRKKVQIGAKEGGLRETWKGGGSFPVGQKRHLGERTGM